jgi:hypothetical protein
MLALLCCVLLLGSVCGSDETKDHYPDAAELQALLSVERDSTQPFLVTVLPFAVSWSTMQRTCSHVQFGASPDALTQLKSGSSSRYSLDDDYESQWIHVVHLPLIDALQFYRVGCAETDVWSLTTRVVAAPLPAERFTVFAAADLGNSLAAQAVMRHMRTRAHRVRSVARPSMLLIAGDLAYGNGDKTAAPNNAWDRFQALLAPVAASMPVVVCEGNHDAEFREFFKPLRARFATPGRWYAFRRGPVLSIMLSTEDNNEVALERAEIDFLRAELQRARAPGSDVQWIVVAGHRPLFDSNVMYPDQLAMRAQLVPLFDEFHVDLYLSGHQHDYERTWPLRANKPTTDRASTRKRPFAKAHGTIYAVIAAERRHLRNILLGYEDSDGNAAGDAEVAQIKLNKAMRKEQRKQGTSVADSAVEIEQRDAGHAAAVQRLRDAANAAIRMTLEGKSVTRLHSSAEFEAPAPAWSAVRTGDAYGYVEMRFGANASGLHWRYWRTDDNGAPETADEFFVCAHEACEFELGDDGVEPTGAKTAAVPPAKASAQWLPLLQVVVGVACLLVAGGRRRFANNRATTLLLPRTKSRAAKEDDA